MSNKKCSKFLLVRISFGGLKRLVIPVPLFVLDITLNAVGDLALLGDLLGPLWKRGLKKHLNTGRWADSGKVSLISLRLIFDSILQVFDELRCHGRWRMVEVETGGVRVYVDFY